MDVDQAHGALMGESKGLISEPIMVIEHKAVCMAHTDHKRTKQQSAGFSVSQLYAFETRYG